MKSVDIEELKDGLMRAKASHHHMVTLRQKNRELKMSVQFAERLVRQGYMRA
jgi:hypothetical protein